MKKFIGSLFVAAVLMSASTGVAAADGPRGPIRPGTTGTVCERVAHIFKQLTPDPVGTSNSPAHRAGLRPRR